MEKDNKQLTPIKVSETDKISDSNFEGFWVLGFDSISNKSVHATMSQMKGNKGDSAFVLWQNQPGNAGKTYEEYVSFNRQPATDAATEVLEKMSLISEDASAAIEAANTAAGNAQDAADNVQDGKTPILESVNAQPGDTPSGDFTANGVDALGNPKYILNLTLPAGKDGQPAVFEQGTTTTVEPNGSASVEVVENGTTPEGNPKYILNFSIPRGQQGPPGAGSGNVSADGTGLVIGKKYLFVPDADDSTAGSFVEYVAPEIPEQVQPDWDATEGKGAILNKPSNATADTSGLMSADQFQKLEKLNPSYLSNDVTGKKVEYTDAGKLLFEGKEAFAVDANNELTLAGKKLSELGGGANVVSIPFGIMSLSPSSTSDEIFAAWGGQQLLLEIAKNFNKSTVCTIAMIEDGYKLLVYPDVTIEYTDDSNYTIDIVIKNQAEGIMANVVTVVSGGIASAILLEAKDVINTSVGGTTADRIYLSYGGNDGFDYRDLIWNNNKRYDDETGQGARHLAYGGSKSIVLTNYGDGTKALMDDGTYKEVGGSYELPTATPTTLGGIKTGYSASGKNYPVQLGSDNKAFVNVPWTDTNTTYQEATTSTAGLMSVTDKTKIDRLRSYTTATTVASLNVNYEVIYVTLSANASLSVSATGTTYNGRTITAYVYTASARTITIPTSGSYISMCGSSYTCPAGKWVEFNLTCVNGIWHIAKLEQE
ncbi:hypothetical protein M1P97_09170 [Parabacteroides sp. GYB001]|uniref:hypothetical protein n=1 Tax=Parabacteroides leei TaxID=2939491 RepID=UPI002017961D|nr:hypothetical protein [Parabacteroides leei]MCL3851455.1 hypothetical protein [Parabacteroides leei]